jgi:plastocyanin
MKTARHALLVLLAASVMSAGPAPAPRAGIAAAVHGHCAPAIVTPVPGDPGAYRIQTAHGTTIARRPSPASPLAAGPIAEFRVFPSSFDADGDTLGTVHDTIVVAPGTTVRWVRRGPGFHTVTNGADSGDPTAALEYNYIFDDTTNVAERVFTTPGRHDFFCFIHEPIMEGSIIVTTATTGVGPTGVLVRAAFTRPPTPNPARGPLAFAIALPRTGPVTLSVLDLAGRRVALLESGVLTAGEHPFRWDARSDDGRLVQSGRYFIRLESGSVRETRPVSIIR